MLKIAHRKDVLFTDHQWWDTVTNAFSGFGGFSHSELLFSSGVSFTSTTDFDPNTAVYPHARKGGGPIFRQINFPESLWEISILPLNSAQEAEVMDWCMNTARESFESHAGYDWAGVLRFVCPWMKEHPQDWFCSESVVAACQTAGLFRNEVAWRISPNKLRKLCRVFD